MKASPGVYVKRLVVTGLLVGAALGLVGLAHLPAARPWLAKLGARCPVGRASAQDVDAVRRVALDSLKGSTLAPSRPAMGLRLGQATEAEVRDWATGHRLSCVAVSQGMRYINCHDVPDAVLGEWEGRSPVSDLSLAFDARGVLVGVDALRNGLSPAEAASLAGVITARLEAELGPPAEAAGTLSAEYLGRGGMRTVFVRHRFRDYLAFVSANHLPWSGTMVREQYLAIGGSEKAAAPSASGSDDGQALAGGAGQRLRQAL